MNKITSSHPQIPIRQYLCTFSHPKSIAVTHSILQSNRLIDQLWKSGRIDEARHLFDKMPCRDEFSWNTMIAAYASSGLLIEAHRLFDEAPNRISITWSSLISGYARHGHGFQAFELFWRMQLEGLKPNQYTLGSILRACSTSAALRRGEQMHAHVVKTQFYSNVFVVTGLVDMYAKCKRISEARYLFERAPDKKNHVLWTSMITGYSQNGDGFKAIECFLAMKREGVGSNQFTFPSVLTACAMISAHYFGMQLHSCIIRSGFSGNVFVKSALIDMYAKCGDLTSGKDVLEGMHTEDVVSWNCLIVGCVRQGFEEEALSLFKKMHLRNIEVDDFTYPSVFNSLASFMDLENGKSVHCLTIKTSFDAYKHVSNALVDMYAKCGSLEYAFRAFETMPEKDVVSWTSLITGCAHLGYHEEALKFFYQMRVTGVGIDDFIIASALSACAGLTVLELGRQLHVLLIRCGFGSSLSIDNSLVAMYAKCGCIEDAHRVFDMMPFRDVVSWTALIVGHAQNGRGKNSLKLYEEMLKTGTRPDSVTFIGLLFACSHAGLVEDGCRYFESMHKVYGISPKPEHYACMIDLLGRAGKISEAEELLNQMTAEPDATVWKALLAACRVHGNLELGERAAKSLFELEPKNAVPYVLLSNIHSAAGRWDEVAKIRRLMKSRGVSKEPGCSWMEVNSVVHAFLAEDRSHPRLMEIYLKVDEMMVLIKEAGYVPDVNFALHDVDEERKEIGLAYHSEKLAVAFGLLSMSPSAPIRIVKNLRVCGDCHTAIKFISKVFERRIILRDANCFHHFSEGLCSCGDYW